MKSIKTKSIRGGARPGAGRKPGSTDMATRDQRESLAELAREHTPAALERLVKIIRSSSSDAAAVSAARELLDRAYGKPPARVSVEDDGTNNLAERLERARRRVEEYERNTSLSILTQKY